MDNLAAADFGPFKISVVVTRETGCWAAHERR